MADALSLRVHLSDPTAAFKPVRPFQTGEPTWRSRHGAWSPREFRYEGMSLFSSMRSPWFMCFHAAFAQINPLAVGTRKLNLS